MTEANNLDALRPGSLESHFVFFYDLKARIINVPPGIYSAPETNTFIRRSIEHSELNQFFFSDNFLPDLLSVHFHGTPNTIENLPHIAFSTTLHNSRMHHEFGFPTHPVGVVSNIPSYAAIECTLFKHGILSVLIRLFNRTPISPSCYLDAIKRPEYIATANPSTGGYHTGALIQQIWPILDRVETHLVPYLNSLTISAVTILGGTPKPLRFHTMDSTLTLQPGDTHDTPLAAEIHHHLKRSRPYIGTIIDLTTDDPNYEPPPEPTEQELRLAVAAARTTPEFLNRFDKLVAYVMEGEPRRNIYYPGPSIVFIGRRGWACIKRERRDRIAFQMGVVEVVLFVIEAILSSVRATRRFVRDVIREGEEAGRDLHLTLRNDSSVRHDTRSVAAGSPEKIYGFTAFLAKIRLIAPFDDMSTLLSSHLTTHTGIAAVQRIRQLSGHQELVDNARTTVANYAAFLHGATQYWLAHNNDSQHKSSRASTLNIRIATIGVILLVVLQIINWLLRFYGRGANY